MLKEVPYYERPREKAFESGVAALSNVELLAILLRTGSKEESVIDLSKRLLYSLDSISRLNEITIEELTNIKGIGNTKAITLLASIELAKRILENERKIKYYQNPKQIYNYYYPILKNLNQEYLYAIYLNTKGVVISEQLITKGTISSSLIDGRDILKLALKLSASAIILIHNHPSGDSTPSLADIKATSKIITQANLMDIVVIDHIIIGDDYYSMKENLTIFKHKM